MTGLDAVPFNHDLVELIELIEDHGRTCTLAGTYAGGGSHDAAANIRQESGRLLADIKTRLARARIGPGHRWTSEEVREVVGLDNGVADRVRDLLNGDCDPWRQQ